MGGAAGGGLVRARARLRCPVSRRKRALRKMQLGARQGEADGENTTGSDNTDTEGA